LENLENLYHHTGSVTHLDQDPVVNKNKKEKKHLLTDRTSAHNDDDTLRIIDDELAKASRFSILLDLLHIRNFL